MVVVVKAVVVVAQVRVSTEWSVTLHDTRRGLCITLIKALIFLEKKSGYFACRLATKIRFHSIGLYEDNLIIQGVDVSRWTYVDVIVREIMQRYRVQNDMQFGSNETRRRRRNHTSRQVRDRWQPWPPWQHQWQQLYLSISMTSYHWLW